VRYNGAHNPEQEMTMQKDNIQRIHPRMES
jgi:hypothetical protein